MTHDASPPITVTEVRVLEGPNLYFPRPAVKVVLEVPGILELHRPRARALAARLGLRQADPGRAHTLERQQVAQRLVRRLVRRLAAGAGIRGLATKTRPGNSPEEVVVAFPWQRRGRGVALAEELGPVLRSLLVDDEDTAAELLEEAVDRIAAAAPGERHTTLTPKVPVASITGTNGKTSTTRLVAHMAMTAGIRTGWSSTSGVFVQGELVEAGDFSGPAGAATVLGSRGLELAVLETARGGMLLKGMGVTHNDVSVVTNVTADHLGMQGIDTVDQLAEVKAIVTKVTRPDGWAVLNGDDPRVWAMRTGTEAKPWAFSLDPSSPALREAVDDGGRGITVLDDGIAVLDRDGQVDRLVALADVPMTLAGLSRHNTANALAATATALGLGVPREAVVEGLRSFAPDGEHNPGRLNCYTVKVPSGGTVTVILDMAHNEDGLQALVEVARGLTRPGARFHLGLGTGGDRTDEILQSMGAMAGSSADVVHVVHKEHYLRGRTREDLEEHLRIGLARVGVAEVDSYPEELDGLQGILPQAGPGDVVAIMTHADWTTLDAWLRDHGARPDTPAATRAKVRRARGEHEHEDALRALRADADLTAADKAHRIAQLLAVTPDDGRLLFELGTYRDSAGDQEEAIDLYHRARAVGLDEPQATRAIINEASSLQRLGRPQDAIELLATVDPRRQDTGAYVALLALAQLQAGMPGTAVGNLVEALLRRSVTEEDEFYRDALHHAVEQLRAAALAAV
ncbi:tetratricopeptide repeat protein [Arsenicicoccus dermatophilus]|uniref:tetratricopeptide repeat protein n=1 Tax=Arsenicicoccus dermatophilus TaxID=1076331 RepID=UPI001F4D09A6|nr:tetratricopeptide repeat protein [Arsenicicoccus dermatophilus]MCH8612542.1 tetratricopeptide repeat protein [Arsenicicoccus dermatophilus]